MLNLNHYHSVVNIRDLNPTKIRAILTSLLDIYDVITLSETFLCQNSQHELALPGFHPILRCDRDAFGGGVATYICDSIPYQQKFLFEMPNVEMLCINVHTSNMKA